MSSAAMALTWPLLTVSIESMWSSIAAIVVIQEMCRSKKMRSGE
jgi:hypothetical protein